MERVGQFAARGAVASGDGGALSRARMRSLGAPTRLAMASKSSTSMLTRADNPRRAELLRGLDSIRSAPHSPPGPDETLDATASPAQPGTGHGHVHSEPTPLSLAGAMETLVSALDGPRGMAATEARLFGFVEASHFAGRVEEIARTVEYLQVVAAQAVERTRQEAQQAHSSAAGTRWRTGWTETATELEREPGAGTATSGPDSAAVVGATAAGPAAVGPAVVGPAVVGPAAVGSAEAAAVVDDGYRNAAEFLRARLRIGIGEARRRLALAAQALPRVGIAGQHIPPRREILAKALESTQIPTRSATIISAALDKVQLLTDEDTLAGMEQALTTTARESDPDFVLKIAKRWTDSIDQDGPEPSEEILRQLQGTFIRKPRHGLHHLEIFATTEQYETLTTAMNTATNPRLTTGNNTTGNGDNHTTGGPGTGGPGTNEADTGGPGTNEAGTGGPGTNSGGQAGEPAGQRRGRNGSASPDLDRRSRAQKLLDGLVGACGVALTTGKLPANGGLRPQVMVTINHHDLLQELRNAANTPVRATNTRTRPAGTPTNQPGPQRTRPGSGAATFSGPIHPNTIRKIACDADIIPVLLGTESRVLDIGRTTRIFPPHIRKAITARDQGCAFPDCTMPAPWCEAHHITYWSHGGTTGTENGTLLCSHHHHLIHKEHWTITTNTGVPWFTPPPHIDPHQTPRRNHHHTPLRT
ncbi:DUF222 domain-containing protein [Arthrobacter sp. StoSoilB5]|uniref:DUF222 domain-containing protein n=1 Tax=Arthrobacter sp. StoSoilB5 TaxID=2830992 RepID=UPI001CC62766|nr:DUF222 domain-containing protein [Arthrobacter sp. StoSoilB5]